MPTPSAVWSALSSVYYSWLSIGLGFAHCWVTLYWHIKTAQQRTIIQQYGVIGTLAVDGWAATFGTARRGLGGLGPRAVPTSLY